MRIDILGQPGWEPLLTRERFRDLRLDHDALKTRFREQDARFREWVAQHAKETASQITTENKAKFFLSQLLFNSVLITAQLHSGGLSIYELGLDSVVSPFMAKGIGVLIGNEKVRDFELAAKEEHKHILAEILQEVVDRFANFVKSATAGLEPLAVTLQSIEASHGAMDAVVQHFLASSSIGDRADLSPGVSVMIRAANQSVSPQDWNAIGAYLDNGTFPAHFGCHPVRSATRNGSRSAIWKIVWRTHSCWDSWAGPAWASRP